MSTYTVYKHTSPSGKVYIGITARPVAQRWHGGSAYRNNAHFYAAIKKYGWDSFRHEILAERLTRAEACSMEIALIAEHRSTDPSHGYNISIGALAEQLTSIFRDVEWLIDADIGESTLWKTIEEYRKGGTDR